MDYVAQVGLRVSMFSHSDILLKVSAVICQPRFSSPNFSLWSSSLFIGHVDKWAKVMPILDRFLSFLFFKQRFWNLKCISQTSCPVLVWKKELREIECFLKVIFKKDLINFIENSLNKTIKVTKKTKASILYYPSLQDPLKTSNPGKDSIEFCADPSRLHFPQLHLTLLLLTLIGQELNTPNC